MLAAKVLCMKRKKKRFYSVSNISDEVVTTKCSGRLKHGTGSGAMLQVTEDTPPDMLAGAMDLTVHLPTGKSVKMAVNRSTPMMDLLVQVTTAHRLQPSGHLIQALSCSPTSTHLEVILPYKPNTPIGALDTQHIRIIPKSPGKSGRSGTLPNGAQPFESTFRLQVHLPRNQLYVIRVSQYVMLQDIMKKVCNEKNLDPKKYEFRHPANLQEVLDPKLSLSDYQLTEVSVVQKGHTISLNDMAALQREEERRRQQTRNGGGVFNLIFKRGKTGVSSGSVSSDTRSISPSRSDDSQSRSISPPVLQTTKILQTIQQETTQTMPLPQEKPKPPMRKRRPAPKPPTANNTVVPNDHNLINSTSNENNQKNTANQNHNSEKKEIIETGLTISHSRNSSDSSGYHEASILSDTVNLQTLPRKNKHNTGSMSNISQKSGTQIVEDKSTTNLTRMEIQSKSTSNLVTTGRKKKPPPPPPVVESSVSTTILNKPTTVDARVESPLEESATNTSSWSKTSPRVSDISLQLPSNPPSSPPKLSISSETSVKLSEAPVKSSEKFNISTVDFSKNETPVKKVNSVTVDKKKEDIILFSSENNNQDLIETDWQYQLPPPPSEFRDSSPTNMTELTNYETVTLNGLPQSECTIVDTPQLLKSIEDFSDTISSRQSEVGSQISEDFGNKKSTEKILTSGYLSLDDLEKRKSLFLEKELASLSCDVQHEIASKKLINELEGVINGTTTLQRTRKQSVGTETDFSTLPNFKITTYNQPKTKINIFEDDSIRSNNDNKRSNVEPIPVRKTSGITERDLNVINNTITQDSQKPALKSKPILDEHIFKKPNLINLKNSPFSKSMNSLNASVENNNVKVNKIVQRSDSLYDKEVKELKLNPVKRSKSHISLDKYKNGINGTNISNNWNISDLQSLQVMRTILPKISNSQPSSPSENIQNHMEVKNTSEFKNNSEQTQISTKTDKTESINEVRRYRYSPPSVNLGTWSERPKVTVNIKSDQDYKFGNSNDVSKKYITSNIKNHSEDTVDSGKVSIKINDNSQQEVQKNSEKVIIKIAATETNKNFIISPPKTVPVEPKPISQEQKALTMRIINHTTATGFKKPETKLPRPHSIAFDSSLTDISRIPIVRAVELKKTFQDNQNNDNTSITQINSENLPKNVSSNEEHGVKTKTTQNGNSSFNGVTRNGSFNISNGAVNGFHNSTYTLPHKNNLKNNPNFEDNVESKPYNFSTLLNRYSSSENINKPLKINNHLLKSAPVVKGFRTVTPMETEKPKPSWKTNSLTKSLDSEKMLNKSYSANSSVPFSQSTLKYTNSITKRDLRNNDNSIASNTFTVNGITHYNNNVPPPPPSMPKVKIFTKKLIVNNDSVDQRTQLLDAIKNFGGRESLKPIK